MLSYCYDLLSLIAKSYNFNDKSMIWVKDEWVNVRATITT